MDTLSYKTVSLNKGTVEKEWILIDAENEVLGRLASRVAMILRGKHKPGFTPHVDCGDNVVIVNAEKVVLSGNKFETKQYVRHTGYPGGKRVETPRDVMAKDPRRLIERAVRGMLPHNRLGRQLFHNMKIYVGPEHEQKAQKPRKIKLSDIK